MNEHVKFITKQALSLPRDEQEALYRALAESLSKPDADIDKAWLDEANCIESIRQQPPIVQRKARATLLVIGRCCEVALTGDG